MKAIRVMALLMVAGLVGCANQPADTAKPRAFVAFGYLHGQVAAAEVAPAGTITNADCQKKASEIEKGNASEGAAVVVLCIAVPDSIPDVAGVPKSQDF